jgi:hypothetical protein
MFAMFHILSQENQRKQHHISRLENELNIMNSTNYIEKLELIQKLENLQREMEMMKQATELTTTKASIKAKKKEEKKKKSNSAAAAAASAVIAGDQAQKKKKSRSFFFSSSSSSMKGDKNNDMITALTEADKAGRNDAATNKEGDERELSERESLVKTLQKTEETIESFKRSLDTNVALSYSLSLIAHEESFTQSVNYNPHNHDNEDGNEHDESEMMKEEDSLMKDYEAEQQRQRKGSQSRSYSSYQLRQTSVSEANENNDESASSLDHHRNPDLLDEELMLPRESLIAAPNDEQEISSFNKTDNKAGTSGEESAARNDASKRLSFEDVNSNTNSHSTSSHSLVRKSSSFLRRSSSSSSSGTPASANPLAHPHSATVSSHRLSSNTHSMMNLLSSRSKSISPMNSSSASLDSLDDGSSVATSQFSYGEKIQLMESEINHAKSVIATLMLGREEDQNLIREVANRVTENCLKRATSEWELEKARNHLLGYKVRIVIVIFSFSFLSPFVLFFFLLSSLCPILFPPFL